MEPTIYSLLIMAYAEEGIDVLCGDIWTAVSIDKKYDVRIHILQDENNDNLFTLYAYHYDFTNETYSNTEFLIERFTKEYLDIILEHFSHQPKEKKC